MLQDSLWLMVYHNSREVRRFMKKETRTVVLDEALHIEAYWFEGTRQPFLNHFHDYYVIGLVEDGERWMVCKNREYRIGKGDIVVFNPGDNHGCVQSGEGAFDYRGFHISRDIMLELAEEVTGRRELPGFFEPVVHDREAACYLRSLHGMVMEEYGEMEKEEQFLFLISVLIQKYGQPFACCVPECREEIERACGFIRQHFQERLSLEQICRHVGLSKSSLLRAFTRTMGITPYRYLETIRINEAKALLEQGVQPVEAAMRTGFSDQSHFTNYFSRFIGLPPGAYREVVSGKNREEGENLSKK